MKHYLFLLFAFLLTAGSSMAQFPQKAGDPVEYSRIRRPRLKGSHPLAYTRTVGERPFSFADAQKGVTVLDEYHSGKNLTMDDIQKFNAWGDAQSIRFNFRGNLLRTRDHTPEDVERAIQAGLRLMGGWTRADVKAAHDWVNKIRDDDYSTEEFWKDITNMINMTGTASTAAGVATQGLSGLVGADDAIRMVMTEGGDAIAGGQPQPWYNYTPPYLAFGAVKSTVTSLRDFINTLEKADARKKQLERNRIGAMYERDLAQFYDLVSKNLTEQRGEIWMISVYGSAIGDFNFEETLCKQAWDIKMELKDGYDDAWKGANPEAYKAGYEGVYMGTLDAHLVFNFLNYDKSFVPRTEGQVWTALTSSDLRAIGLHWKLSEEANGGNFSYVGATSASAHHILPVMLEVKKRNPDSPKINAYLQIVEPDMLRNPVSGLPQKRLNSHFAASHQYRYSISKEGFSYDGLARMYNKNDSTLVLESKQDLKTPGGSNIIESAVYAMFRALVFTDIQDEKSSDYYFRREIYPVGEIEIDLQTSSADPEE